MNREILAKFCLVLFLLVVTFGSVQFFGNYLVRELNGYEEMAPISDQESQNMVVKRMVLRLEPVNYYTIQVGSFADSAVGQGVIDQLAATGYRVYTKPGPPYKLWLGCFGSKNEQLLIPEEVKQIGQDIFITENLLNTTALKFAEDDLLIAEQVAPLVANYDVLLKHSFKMFTSPLYTQYDDAMWAQMIGQIDGEIAMLILQGEEILAKGENQAVAQSVMDLNQISQEYRQSLQLILEKKNDKVLYLVQSYLLQLIDQYHGFIDQMNQLTEVV